MSDEQAATTAAATEAAPVQTTMADIANSIPAESTTEVPATKPADNVGDFTAFAERINALTQKVEATSQQTAEIANSQQAEVLNKEISKAVESINENVGGDADMAELFLEKQYRDNPDLKKVWDNRAANPEALDKALGIMKEEWAAKNVNTIDPAVAENQRALRESQKGGSTVQVDSLHQELDKMDSGEFMQYAHRLAQGG